MTAVRCKNARGSRGVARVEVDLRPVGWVRKHTDGWRAKLTDETDYRVATFATRQEAAESLVST